MPIGVRSGNRTGVRVSVDSFDRNRSASCDVTWRAFDPSPFIITSAPTSTSSELSAQNEWGKAAPRSLIKACDEKNEQKGEGEMLSKLRCRPVQESFSGPCRGRRNNRWSTRRIGRNKRRDRDQCFGFGAKGGASEARRRRIQKFLLASCYLGEWFCVRAEMAWPRR